MPRALCIDGEPTFLLGVNYWSRAGGPRMWERFDPEQVRRELAQMRGIGLNTCRSFAFLPTFMPRPPRVAGLALKQLRQFFDLCVAEQMTTIPSFLVGHMSGENYDFPGQEGRSPYTDPEVIGWQRALIGAIAEVGEQSAAVVAYLASNEMPNWGGRSDPGRITSWARTLRAALHERDDRRPFSLGDGVANLAGGQDGFDVGSLRDRDLVDFVGPHTYYADADPLRQALNAEYCVRSLTHLGLPVLFEEFGCSSTQASEESQRLYYREVLHACLSTGAAGALGWCFTDFDLVDDPPYTHHAFELGFGITRADGSEKPVCQELRDLARLVDRIDWPALEPPRPMAAILVPSYFNTTYPFSLEDRDRMRRTLLQAYALCVAAGIEAELIPEENDLAPYRLVLAPSTQKLLSTTWQRMIQHAQAGNTVYWSYFNGDQSFLWGAWCHLLPELIGCRHELRYACVDLPDEEVRLEGDGLAISTRTDVGGPFPRAMLPIEPRSASVLARDNQGRPALVQARHGQGQVLFLNHPLEYYLAEQHGAMPGSSAHQLYRLIGAIASAGEPLTCPDPSVQVRVVQGSSPLLWVINHAWSDITAQLDTPGGEPLHGARRDQGLPEGQTALELAPKQVLVYRLNR